MRRRLLHGILLPSLLAWGCTSTAERAEALAGQGLERARAGDLVAAADRFREALALDADNLKARYNVALVHLSLRQGAEAATHLQRFLALRPDDGAGHFELARAWALAGRAEDALGELQHAVRLGFSDYQALAGGGFERMEDDLRFVQLRVLLAQRAGVELEPAEAGGVREGYGGLRTHSVALPGVRVNDPGCEPGEPETTPTPGEP